MALIAIIDDDPDIREVVSVILKSQGHEIIQAVNGNEGLAQLKKVSLNRFGRCLNDAREALHVLQSFNRPDFSKASSLATLSRVAPIPRSLAG